MAEPVSWVETHADLDALIERLTDEPRLALDTESNSMHAYFERVCLVQISIPGADYLVDPLAVDISPLGAVLADPAREKVLHGADFDVLSLKRYHGFAFANLFDTMLAARVLGWPQYGLASILEARFGHSADKRFQRYDWGRRPLSTEAVEYARFDTHFLLELRDAQWEQLVERERVEECVHACARQAQVEPRPRAFDPGDFWRIKGARDLSPPGPAVLRALFVYRDEVSRDLDRPAFRVMNDAVLVALARARPTDRRALGRIKGLGRPMLHRRASDLLNVILEGSRAEEPPPRKAKPRGSRAVTARYDALRAWRKAIAAERGVEPDIVLPKSVLLALAEAAPRSSDELADVDAIDDWERGRYGPAILEALAGTSK